MGGPSNPLESKQVWSQPFPALFSAVVWPEAIVFHLVDMFRKTG